jgi:hypothetical protein
MYGYFPAKNTVHTPYMPINVWLWPTLDMLDRKVEGDLAVQDARSAMTLAAAFQRSQQSVSARHFPLHTSIKPPTFIRAFHGVAGPHH